MTAALTYTAHRVFFTQECISCGVAFGVPDSFDTERRRDHKSFYCPNGHSQCYVGKTEEQKQRERAERLAVRLTHVEDQRQAAELSARAYRGHLTRLRNRIRNGVCPWCNRHFENVMRHVASEHPEHEAKAEEATVTA